MCLRDSPNNDSSIQSYANIYDQNWLMKGNVMIAPGIARVDPYLLYTSRCV